MPCNNTVILPVFNIRQSCSHQKSSYLNLPKLYSTRILWHPFHRESHAVYRPSNSYSKGDKYHIMNRCILCTYVTAFSHAGSYIVATYVLASYIFL